MSQKKKFAIPNRLYYINSFRRCQTLKVFLHRFFMKQLKTHLPVNLYTRQHYLTAMFTQTQCPIKEKTAVFLGFSLENGYFSTMGLVDKNATSITIGD